MAQCVLVAGNREIRAMKLGLFRKCPFFVFAIFPLILGGCATLGQYNPATGRSEFIFIPTDTEVDMGKSIHEEIVKQYGLSGDTAQTERIRRIGNKLAKISDRQDYQYHFYLLNSKDINAFTTPGGNIYFFTGLLNALKSDEEIAAVLAHEIGHCSARHTIKKYQAALGYNLIGSLVFSQVQMGDAAKQTLSLASNTAVQLAMSAYGRQDEYQADRLGIKYMYLAGYDLNGMIKTLQALEKESKGQRPPLILSTHPYAEDRIQAAEEEIKLAPSKYNK